jgi:hypothetical protein
MTEAVGTGGAVQGAVADLGGSGRSPIALTPLEPGQRGVLHVAALLPSVVLAAGGVALGLAMESRLGWPSWPAMLVLGAVAIWMIAVAPRRRWAAWGWALDGDELHVAHGVWTQVHTVVPLARVQHLDVAQGPIERAFGVARLVLHTAGTAHATVVLPGVSRASAEHLRDTIRAHIRAELW